MTIRKGNIWLIYLFYVPLQQSLGFNFNLIVSKNHQCSLSWKNYGQPTKMSLLTEDSSIDEDTTLPQRLREMANVIKAEPKGKARALKLVEYGNPFTLGHGGPPFESLGPSKRKIPGCLAEVFVDVHLDNENRVTVSGVADARVPGGLLALVAQGSQGQAANVVLGLDAGVIAEAAGLASAVTPSRMNGLRNIVKVVQDLLKEKMTSKEGSIAHGKTQDFDVEEKWTPPQGLEDEIAVLLSGGVDSSVALRLLIDQGYKPRCFYLKIWLEDELAYMGECPWEEDMAYAQAVCDQAGVPLEVLSLQQEYWNQVVKYTISEAKAGRTPNPDIMCNSRIKFGMFYEYAGKYFKHVATGHYARVRTVETEKGPVAQLLCSPDPIKDQTYFLSTLRQDQLAKALFPVGEYQKSEIRELAQKYDLPTQTRKDSQGICFLGKLKFDEFLAHYLGENPGPVVDFDTGEVIGEHKGLWFHTIGQRKGLGPSLFKGQTNRGPWYVIGKCPESNKLTVSNRHEMISDKPRNLLVIKDCQWVTGDLPTELKERGVLEAMVKLRHGPNIVKGTVRSLNEKYLCIQLEKNDSIAPGQFAALYQNGQCLGAGAIVEMTVQLLDTIMLMDSKLSQNQTFLFNERTDSNQKNTPSTLVEELLL